tara:strand:- start:3659 stop:5140 length:1482 start_codon:yes stop_codon:yes gene_type:complete
MKLFQQLLVAGAAVSMIAPLAAQATDINLEDMNSYSSSSKSAGFTNNYVNIQPGDWVHQSIKDLATSRGCDVNVSDKALTRFEAAAIVNSCLGNVAEVSNVERTLIDEFSSELALIRGRLDGIEARMNEFEAGAFSSTTAMDGFAKFAIGAVDGNHELSGNGNGGAETDKTSVAYVYQMNLNTSFTGDDNLYVRLKAGNGWANFDTKAANYHIDAKGTSSAVNVDKIWYTFPIGDNFTATAGPLIENYYMLAATPSVYKPGVLKAFKLGGHGAAFGASTSPGVGLKYAADNGFAASITGNSYYGNTTSGFFTKEDKNKVNTQVAYTGDNFHVSATYTIQSGGWNAWEYFATDMMGTTSSALDADGYALRAWWRPDETGSALPSISVGYDKLNFDGTVHTKAKEGSGYTVALNWQDMFTADDRIGVAIGAPMSVDEKAAANSTNDVDPFIWEAYYSFRPNDSIELTPAVFGGSDVLSDKADDIFGAVLTTTFKF